MIVDRWKYGSSRLSRTIGATFLSSLSVLLMASCISGGSSTPNGNDSTPGMSQSSGAHSPPGQSSKDVIASTKTSSTEIGREFRIDIHSLRRSESDALILDFSMVNLSATESVAPYTPPEASDNPAGTQIFTLIDGINRKKHLPLLYTDGSCYCKGWDTSDLEPGGQLNAWVAFPEPPDDVSSMTFISAAAPPVLDIPIDDSPSPAAPEMETDPPQIWDLHSYEDNLSNGSTRNEGPDEIAISLSSDVLFETNKSDLSESANNKIEQVAQEVDDSSTKEVQVDGHTDDTGNDSINKPLSEDRAQAVHELLNKLVEKDVAYSVSGHGSSKPIATNDTDKGRSKNRRVTITFTR